MYDHHGLKCIKVQTGGRPTTLMQVTNPSKDSVTARQVRNKKEAVNTFAEWTCRGQVPMHTAVMEKLTKSVQDPGVMQLVVPQYGTLQLKTDLLLCDSQLRTLRRIFASWGGHKLAGWRRLAAQEKKLRYPLKVELKELEVGQEKSMEPVMVVRAPSVKSWLFQRLEVLRSAGWFRDHEYLGGRIAVVVHADSGQGSTKVALRLLNVPHDKVRSVSNLDCICIFEGNESYDNLEEACGDLLREIQAMHETLIPFDGAMKELVFFLSSDHKMHSILAGHQGQSATFFSIYDYLTLKMRVAGKVCAGGVLQKYRHLASPPVEKVPPKPAGTVVKVIRPPLRTLSEVQADAARYVQDDSAHLGPAPLDGVAYRSITKPPLLFLGANYTLAAPVHNNIGVVTDIVRELEEECQHLDLQGLGGATEAVKRHRESCQAEVDKCDQTMLHLKELHTTQQAVVATLMDTVVRVRNRVADAVSSSESESSDQEGDARPNARQAHREAEGMGWLPTRRQQTRGRRRRLATREAARQLRLRESEEELSTAQGELAVTEQKLHKAEKLLITAKHNLKKVRGDRMRLLEKALLVLGLRKTCYFGHAYIGKHCKRLCESEVAVAITAPLLFGFSRTDRRERTDAWVRACQRREAWVLRLTKWGAVQQLLGGSYDFAAMPHLLPQLVVRAASFAGFVASHFPSHRPTPKELFAVSQGVYFV